MRQLILICGVGSLIACASPRTRLVEAEWASMTQSKVPQATEVTSRGPVKGDFCFTSFGKGHVGLMDEALRNTQTNYSIDYVKNAAFKMDERNLCVYVEGEGYKLKN